MVDPRFGTSVIEELKKKGHLTELPPEEYTLWPFAEPNGIVRENKVLKSGVTPYAKPAHASGY